MVARGTIVRLATRPQAGLWAVMEEVSAPHPHRPGHRRYRIRQDNGFDRFANSYVIGVAGLEVVAEPTFTPGMAVTHWGEDVEVVADKGDLVRIRQEKRVEMTQNPLTGNPIYRTHIGEAEVSRGALVAENLERLLTQEN